MYFHILIGISALTFCAGDSSNHAISSVNFHRDDVPLSYQYSYVHIYSTEKPNSRKNQAYRNIQYAPLSPNQNDDQKYDPYTRVLFSRLNKKQNFTKNGYLEPQVHNAGINYNRKFVDGYNIDTQKLGNINHNNINLQNKNIATRNQEMNKLILPKANAKNIPTLNHDSLKYFNNLQVLDARQHHENPTKSIRVLSELENAQIQPIFNPYVRVPRLHLNVARGYNNARTPVDTTINGDKNFFRIHSKQTNVKQVKTPFIQKTFLFPRND